MKFLQRLTGWFPRRGIPTKKYPLQGATESGKASEKFVCIHGPTKTRVKVKVFGKKCEFDGSPFCLSCTEQYLNQFSTVCASCGRPIFPGTPVGQAWVGAPYPYTHLTFNCCDTGALYCGRWGEGRLITLHELDPEKYPPDTASVVGHTFNVGKVVIENVD